MLINDKRSLIEDLTGVKSSKLNYYLELKKRNEEIIKQNNRLEIIHQIVKDINIDMSIADILMRTYSKLPSVLPCDTLVLALMENGMLRIKAMEPQNECSNSELPKKSFLYQCIQQNHYCLYNFDDGKNVCEEICDCKEGKKLNISSVLTIPLFVRGKVIGVLLLGACQPNAYHDNELVFCNQLADQLAICVENARLYEEVLQSKREWEETFTAVIDPIFLIDLNFNVIKSNNRPLSYLRCQQTGKLQDMKCYQLLWGRDKKCTRCLMEEVIKTGKPSHREMQTGGCVLDVHYYPVFNSEHKIYAVIHHIQDKTEKVKMEAQLIQSAKLAAIGEMAAGVAHELNSPLTVIIGTAQMLLRENTEGTLRRDFLKDIENCGLRCKRIIQNLLTFSRQEQQPMGPTDINDQVEKVLSLTQYQINRSKISVKTELAENLPLLFANGQQLQQVLINLLLNARDALEQVNREKQITIRTLMAEKNNERQIWLEVEDNGEGIAESKLDKVFNPFYTSKEAAKGTGLGLSVSLGIAQAHGGTINVESVLGQGSKFRVVLPLNQN